MVKVDATIIHIDGVKNVQYQALIVVDGTCPPTQFPSALQGGTFAPDFEVSYDATFNYKVSQKKVGFTTCNKSSKSHFFWDTLYLKLPLDSRCKKKVDHFKSLLKGSFLGVD